MELVFIMYLRILNNKIIFLDVVRKSQAINQNITVSSESTSLNVESIQFKNYNQFIKDMPLGVYNFESLSNTEKIELKKYIGPPKYFSSNTSIPNDWKT